jgi:hypothetical protein
LRRRRRRVRSANSSGTRGTYFGIDPNLDMVYILVEQTQKERGRIRVAFKKLVYDALMRVN